MDSYKIKSLEELYFKLLPAFRVKVNELKREKITYIKEKDMWNYLKDTVWSKRENLTLGDMVNDIITMDYREINNWYLNRKRSKNDN